MSKNNEHAKCENYFFRKTPFSACVSGGKKCSLFGKFGVLFFLETPVLRFAILPYYRRIFQNEWKFLLLDHSWICCVFLGHKIYCIWNNKLNFIVCRKIKNESLRSLFHTPCLFHTPSSSFTKTRGEAKNGSLFDIRYTYPTMMKLSMVITWLKKIPKTYKSRDTPLVLCWHQHFSPEIAYYYIIWLYVGLILRRVNNELLQRQ